MYIFCLVAYLLVAVSLVLLIMLQHGKGVDIGGNSFNMRNLLGGIGTNPSSNLVTRLTAILGVLFFLLSLLLGNISSQYSEKVYVNNSVVLEQAPNNNITTGDVETGATIDSILKS